MNREDQMRNLQITNEHETNFGKNNFKKLEIEIGTEKQRKVLQEAQMLDQNGQKAQFFYNSTIQPLTAVTKAIKARFTFKKQQAHEEADLNEAEHQNQEDEQQTTMIQTNNVDQQMKEEEETLDHNLITFCANVLKIYKCTPEGVFPVLTQKFNDKIVDILRVPTASFAKDEEKETPDYLFIVTKTYTICLVCFDAEQEKLVVISRGNVGEKAVYFEKQTPYPIFLAPNKSFIAMMPYQNILKVIPLAKAQNSKFLCQMSNSYTERIAHSNVLQLIPLAQNCLSSQSEDPLNSSHQYIGVLCQQAEHFTNKISANKSKAVHSMRVSLSVEISYLDQQKFQLLPLNNVPFGSPENKLDSNSVYRIEPMPFGGYLAFDIGSVSYILGSGSSKTKYQIQLQSANHITAFQQVDNFEFGEDLTTKTDQQHIRFLFATETGELFFLAFQKQILQRILLSIQYRTNQTTSHNKLQQSVKAERLMQVSFMARGLSFCNSLVYLDNSVVFYGSKEGDSFLLKLQSKTSEDLDMPYATIAQRFHSMAPIIDLSLASPEQVEGQQSELVAVCGWNNQSNVSLVRQGVGLKSYRSLADVIPAKLTRQVFSFQDVIFMRLYGFENLVGLKVTTNELNGEKVMNVDGFDVPRDIKVQPNEQILCLSVIKSGQEKQIEEQSNTQEKLNDIEMTFNKNQQSFMIYATETQLKLLSLQYVLSNNQDQKVLQEIITVKEDEPKMSHVKVCDDLILVANTSGQITLYKLQVDATNVQIIKIGTHNFGSPVSALCLAKSENLDQKFAYVSLFDAPFYSFVVLGLTPRLIKEEKIPLLAKISLSVLINFDQMKQFQLCSQISEGIAFEAFSKSKKEDLVEEMKDVERECPQITKNRVIQQTQCSAACSIEHLMVESHQTDTVFIGFESGRICQFYLDFALLNQTFEDPQTYAPYTSHDHFFKSRLPIQSPAEDMTTEDTNDGENGHNLGQDADMDRQNLDVLVDASTGPFWGFKVSYTSTIAPQLSKIEISQGIEAVLACSDRPVVFYEQKESVEMHYLAFEQIKQVVSVCPQNESPTLFFEDCNGVVHFSETDSLKRLSIKRMLFKMQITKTLTIKESDLILGLFEQPNLEYLDSTKNSNNIIGLLDKGTLSAKAIYELKAQEIANCAEHVKNGGQDFIFVGTAFLRPEEQVPQNGRLLIFEANSMKLVQEYDIEGSVQSVLIIRDRNLNCMVLGVNNIVKVFEIQTLLQNLSSTRSSLLLNRQAKQLKLVEEVVCGTFIHSICILPISKEFEKCSGVRSLIVADMAGRGISSFNLSARGQQIKLENSARSHLTIWVNSVVPLSESQFSVFDHQGNIFIFKKCLFPSSIQEMLKLTLSASFYVGQEVQCAAFGNLHAVNDRSRLADDNSSLNNQRKAIQKQEAYVRASPETMLEYEKYTKTPRSQKQASEMFSEEAQKRKRLINSVTGEQNDQIMATNGNELVQEIRSDLEKEQEIKQTRGAVQKQHEDEERKIRLDQMEIDVHDLSQSYRILQEPDFARKFAQTTLEEMYALHNQKNSLIYGTSEGSIGQLQQITPKVYLLCQLLQVELDSRTKKTHDLTQQKRSDYRKVKGSTCLMTEVNDAEQNVSNGIIDGDFVEQILEAPRSMQITITRGICSHQVRNEGQTAGADGSTSGDEYFTELVIQIITLLKNLH